MQQNIILVGFSFTGKSAVARALAHRIGWTVVDTDDLVSQRAGRSIREIFDEEGEEQFRRLEAETVRQACSGERQVIATGGGVVVDADSRALMLQSGVMICLEALPTTIHTRMLESRQRGRSRQVRPLLDGEDLLESIIALKSSRQHLYAECHWTVHTDGLRTDQVVDRIIHGYETVAGRPMVVTSEGLADYWVTTESQSYPGYVGWGILNDLGQRMVDTGLSGVAYIVADRGVFDLHGKDVESGLKRAGFHTDTFLVDTGEASKSLRTVESVYQWLAERRAERAHVIVSVGGGMVGDLAGFVAATYLRGMPLVHVPMSLLSMVDASIGGKVAVNLAVGKNLVGSFYQPRLVLSDVATLVTLPPRELTAGWAEVIKHAVILDSELFEFIKSERERLLALDPDLTTEVIRRSAAIKAAVVSEDEKETTGRRMLLNYGHTIGHGLEVAAGFGRFLHGEAVAIGMAGAALLSHRLGILDSSSRDSQQRVLASFGLPSVAHAVDESAVRSAIQLDKKVAGRSIRWVVLEEIGRSTIRADVPDRYVDEALAAVCTP